MLPHTVAGVTAMWSDQGYRDDSELDSDSLVGLTAKLWSLFYFWFAPFFGNGDAKEYWARGRRAGSVILGRYMGLRNHNFKEGRDIIRSSFGWFLLLLRFPGQCILRITGTAIARNKSRVTAITRNKSQATSPQPRRTCCGSSPWESMGGKTATKVC